MAMINYAPRKTLWEWLANGFSPVPKFDYKHNDYAFVVCYDGVRRTNEQAKGLAYRLKRPKVAV